MAGLWTRPPRKDASALPAFGAGTLLFAPATELFGHALRGVSGGHDDIVNALIVT